MEKKKLFGLELNNPVYRTVLFVDLDEIADVRTLAIEHILI